MPTDFWSGWIIVVTLVSLAALAWMIFSVYAPAEDEPEHDSPVWDETLTEGSNPAPLWWFWLILALMVLSVLYLMLYPGLGSFRGALNWSQGGRLEESLSRYAQEFGGVRKLVAEARFETLHEDDALMRSAQRIYDRNCAVCHGYEAQGQANLFPNLVDDEWQWGGSTAQIDHSIRLGRQAVMVGWAQVLGGDDGVQRVVDYVRVLGTDAAPGHPGQVQYNMFCVACHGADGGGNVALGAPNLVDDIWLYGDSDEALTHSIAIGRNGVMPAFGDRLDETQIRLLTALLTR
ncbi:MAG: cytochrome-c oxidase, cbb3-type subunit III [Woeseiaceae bacterium]|nr:cytochrome-c oxidase, cbb3-type subunit III [Woeseiaceae bacterium]